MKIYSILTQYNNKLEYKEVCNATFAKFIVDGAESIEDIRGC